MLTPKKNFSWSPFQKFLEEEIASYGFSIAVTEKKKSKDTAIKSAFLKGNTLQELIKIGVNTSGKTAMHPNTQLKIKLEIDTSPPLAFPTEVIALKEPIPVSIRSVTLEGLFAGKMHATLFREWKNRVKGRDWYDMIWYIRKGIPLNLTFFSKISGQDPFSKEDFLKLMHEKIDSLDLPSAIEDILPFISETDLIQREWSKNYFHNWTKEIIFTS